MLGTSASCIGATAASITDGGEAPRQGISWMFASGNPAFAFRELGWR